MDNTWIPTPLIKVSDVQQIIVDEKGSKKSLRRFRIMAGLLLLFLNFIRLVVFRRPVAVKMGRSIADFCQASGVLWVKLGQLLSMRSDLFPYSFCRELNRLQDRVDGFCFEQVKDTLEKELGAPMDHFFTRFEKTPCAAASIAQVHKAYLKKEKVWVAVKVMRPQVDRVFSQDMGIMRQVFLLLHRLSIMSFMRWPDMLAEMEQVFQEEMDYRYEIVNQQRLKKTLAAHRIYVPKVFKNYCSRKVLVMEYIEGTAMTDFLGVMKTEPDRLASWMDENNIDPVKVGRRLFLSYLRQVLEDNLFHADLHPGNIILLRNSRIALLDFGSLGTSEGDLLRKYDIFLQALSTGQYAKAVDVFLLIMPHVPSVCLPSIKDEMQRRFLAWDQRCRVRELPYEEKSTNMVFDEMTRVMGKYGVNINWAFFKLLRGWTTMDTSLRQLIPEADLPRWMQAYIRRRELRELKSLVTQLPEDLLKLQNLIDYPGEFSERAIYRGAAIRRLAQVFEGTTTRLSRLLAIMFQLGAGFFFVLGLLFGCAGLHQHTAFFSRYTDHAVFSWINAVPALDVQIWILAAIVPAYGFFTSARLAGRLRENN